MEASTLETPVVNKPRGLVVGAHEAVDKIADAASQAAETLAEKRARLREAGTGLWTDSRRYVNENPGIALGIAAAAGFLLRHLIRPRQQ